MKLRLTRSLSGLAGLLVAGFAFGAIAQDFPSRPVTLVVPSPPGGPTDTVGRLVAEYFGRALGQPVVVENVPGASATVGTGDVARSAPDGYRVLLNSLALTTTPAFMSGLPYDPLTDLEPVGLINVAPFVVISRRDFSANTAEELFATLKEKGPELNFAHGGVGGGAHLCAIFLGQRLQTDLTIISYAGAGPALTDVVGGQVDLFCAQATDAVPQLAAGTIKAFATTGGARIPQLPDLPTLEELGLPDTQITQWHGIWAPKDTPDEIVDKLNAALRVALKDPDLVSRLEGLGSSVYPDEQGTPEAMAEHVAAQLKLWADVAQRAGIQPQ